MNWLQKICRTKYLDDQMFERPGFPNWRDKISEINTKRDRIRVKAEKICTSNGHILFPWTCMNSTLCRKCGATVYLHNIHGTSDAPDFEGRAITSQCSVHLKTDEPYQFSDYKVQDYHGDTVI